MMYFTQAEVADAAKHVEQYASIEVIRNETDILVITDSSQAINEFEARLASGKLEWDGEDCNGVVLLETLINIQGVRTEFRPRHTNDEWQARYSIVTAF